MPEAPPVYEQVTSAEARLKWIREAYERKEWDRVETHARELLSFASRIHARARVTAELAREGTL